MKCGAVGKSFDFDYIRFLGDVGAYPPPGKYLALNFDTVQLLLLHSQQTAD